MAKKPIETPAENKVGSFMESLIQAAKQSDTGHMVACGEPLSYRGFELPSLALKQFYGSNVFPFGKVIEFAGPPGSGKSAMAFWHMDFFARMGGLVVFIETENKTPYGLFNSILDKTNSSVAKFLACTIVSTWQANATLAIETYIKEATAFYKKASKGEIYPPMLIVVDSLSGCTTSGMNDTIRSSGAAAKAFPEAALLNARYIEWLNHRIADFDITVIYTNHSMKDLADDKNPNAQRTKGGDTPSFLASFRALFEQSPAVELCPNKVQSQSIKAVAKKNCMNRKGTKLHVKMQWLKTITENNDENQITVMDWNGALAMLLDPGKGQYSYDRKSVSPFCCVIKNSNTKYSCSQLGLKGVSPSDIGAAIEGDPALADKMSPHLGIKKWDVIPALSGSLGPKSDVLLDSDEAYSKSEEEAEEPSPETEGGDECQKE